MWNQSPVFSRMNCDQLVGVAQLAAGGEARGQVAAQRDDVADAARAGSARAGPAGPSRVEATQDRCGAASKPGGADLEHRLQRALARGAARAEGAPRRTWA